MNVNIDSTVLERTQRRLALAVLSGVVTVVAAAIAVQPLAGGDTSGLVAILAGTLVGSLIRWQFSG